MSPCWAPCVCWELQRGPQVWGAAVVTVPHGPPSWSCPTAVLHRLVLCWALGRELMGAGWRGPGGSGRAVLLPLTCTDRQPSQISHLHLPRAVQHTAGPGIVVQHGVLWCGVLWCGMLHISRL